MTYYLYDQNTTTGSYSIEQIVAIQNAGSLSLYTLYAAEGDTTPNGSNFLEIDT